MGMPAARMGDFHACPAVCPGPAPHVGGPISAGSPNVIVGGMAQARVGDTMVCACAPDTIAAGSGTVLVNNMPAARLGDSGAHGSSIVVGFPTVLIG
ncbi:MAG: PAAR domain-containing protein [Bacteroidota bacterium]